jgi:peptidoglycan/LPS O-acetylase OafA/YrhL
MGLLRFLLAISVVLFHADASGYQMVGGGVAVESFFMISGFYMSLVLDQKYTGTKGRYSLFIGNRLLKLYPAYWTVLILALLMQLFVWLFTGHPILVVHQIVHFKMDLTGIAFLSFSNLAIIGQDLVSFFGLNKATGELFFTPDFMKTYPFLFSFLVIPQGWSLGIELSFYLVAPFLLRRNLSFILAGVALIFLLRMYLLHGLDLHYDPWIFRFFPSQLLLFLAGNLSYRLYVKTKTIIPSSGTWMYAALIMISVITFLYSSIPVTAYKKEIYLLLIFIFLPVLINAPKISRHDTLLGELSYPVYLSHMLALQTISTLVSLTGFLQNVPIVIPTLILTMVLSILINRFVVRPVDRYRQARVSTKYEVRTTK